MATNTSMAGTPKYTAPELLEPNKRFGFSADVYSISIMFYEVSIPGPISPTFYVPFFDAKILLHSIQISMNNCTENFQDIYHFKLCEVGIILCVFPQILSAVKSNENYLHKSSSALAPKMFMKLTPGINFFFVIDVVVKEGMIVPGKTFQPSLMFGIKAGAYLNGALVRSIIK